MRRVTYSLLVSNIGFVRNDCSSYEEVKSLFDEYAGSKQYEQVTLWSSECEDPIEEAYVEFGAVLCTGCKCRLYPGMSYRIEPEGPICYDCWNGEE